MSKQRQRVLLTGGAGFIGSHLAEALLRPGAQLTIVDNLDPFYDCTWKKANLEAVERVGTHEFHALDICDTAQLSQIMASHRPEVVIHLAACVGVRPSIRQPKLYERVNLAGTVNLLELCRQFHVSRFIFGSSSSVYGATSCVPFSEDQVELRPLSPYAATKLAGEMLAYTYAHLFGLQVICLRFFTVYGARQRPDLAIRKFTSLIEAGKPVPIFGDGSSARDYTFVDDIVAGVLAGLIYELRPASGNAPFALFNVRALITGGAGFLGSHLCDALLAEGHQVVTVDNLLTGRMDNIQHLSRDSHFEFRRLDICESFDCGPVEYVFHFASPAAPADYM